MVNIRGRKLINFGLVAVDIVVAGAFAANIVITHAAKGKTYSDVTLIPHQRVGLVLGSPKRVADGRPNLFFLGRVKAAGGLYRQGRGDYLLARGANGPGDEEPAAVKTGRISKGGRAGRVYLGFAG